MARLDVGHDRGDLGRAFHWLDPSQIDAALAYYRLFPEDVEPFLFHSDEEFEEFVRDHWRKCPHSKPASA